MRNLKNLRSSGTDAIVYSA